MRRDRLAFLIVLWVGFGSALVLVPMARNNADPLGLVPDQLAFGEDGSGTFVDASKTIDTESRRSSGALGETYDGDGIIVGETNVPSVTLRAATTTTTTTTPSVTETSEERGDGEADKSDGRSGGDKATAPTTAGSSDLSTTETGLVATRQPTSTTDPLSATTGIVSTTSTSERGRVTELERYSNNFAGGDLDTANWTLYHSPGHAGLGLRRASAIDVVPSDGATGGSVLQITASMGTGDEAGELVSGGMMLQGRTQTYGRYSVRVRVDADPAGVTSGVVLLWPESGRWPDDGEIDFFEGWANRETRSPVESNLHWADEAGRDQMVSAAHAVSGTEWHTYTLDWRPDLVAVSVDGGKPQVLSTDPIRIPHVPMNLAIQLDNFEAVDRPGEPPVLRKPIRLQVDWVRVEAFAN